MNLHLHSDASGMCHYLAGKAVRSGDLIEVLFHDEWITVKYEWIGKANVAPVGVVNDDATTISITAKMEVRWPSK